MPFSIDIHENEFLEEIWQDSRQATLREILLGQVEEKFGPLPSVPKQRIEAAETESLQRWIRRVVKADTLDEIFS